jgi:hypothetical protein
MEFLFVSVILKYLKFATHVIQAFISYAFIMINITNLKKFTSFHFRFPSDDFCV